jgi:hypothetical protein
MLCMLLCCASMALHRDASFGCFVLAVCIESTRLQVRCCSCAAISGMTLSYLQH